MSQAAALARKKQSEELRKAHFYMGFDKETTMQSNAASHFKEHNLDGAKQTTKEMNALKKDLRATHFLLGTDDPKELYDSSAKASFTEPKNFVRSVLSQDTKKDLRSQHFVFGYHDGCKESENTRSFPERELKKQENRQEAASLLRAHSHKFGDTHNYYDSMYNKNFCQTVDNEAYKRADHKEELKKQVIGLRQSNIKLGEKQQPYDTMQKQSFQGQARIANEIKDNNLRDTNITLGTNQLQYISHAQDSYKGAYQKVDTKQIEKLSKDLRSAHFYMGEDKVNYTSEAAQNFQERPDISNSRPDMSYLYRGNYSFNQYATKPSDYESAYKRTMCQEQEKQPKNIIDTNSIRASSIVLGSDKINDRFKSEAGQNFQDHGNQPTCKLPREHIHNLKTNHFALGTDNNDFKTSVNTMQGSKEKGIRGGLNPEMKKDLRSEHFKYGSQTNDWKTSMNEIGTKQGAPAKLDPMLGKNLRKTNIEDNSYKCDFVSISKQTFKDPGPIVD